MLAVTGFGTTRRHRVAVAESQISPQVEQAEALMEKGQWAEAETLLLQATAADAKDYRAWYDLANVYSQQGKNTEAIDASRKSVEAKSDVFETNLHLGLLLARQNLPDAEKYLTAATSLTPASNPDEGRYRAWYALGELLSEKNPSSALAAYREAIRLKPKEAEPHFGAAVILERSSDWAGAEREYQAALQLDPKSPNAVKGLANVYMRSKRLPEAETMLRKVLETDPGNASAHLQLARVLAAQQKYDEASKELDEGMKSAPTDRDLQQDSAAIAALAGKFPEAEAKYRQLVQAAPKDIELRSALANVLIKEHKYQQAVEQLMICIKLNPRSGDLYGDLATAAQLANNYQLSLAALDDRAKFFPENAGTYFARATNWDHLRNSTKAVEYYKLFLSVANGRFPNQEWQAKHRIIALERELVPPGSGGVR